MNLKKGSAMRKPVVVPLSTCRPVSLLIDAYPIVAVPVGGRMCVCHSTNVCMRREREKERGDEREDERDKEGEEARSREREEERKRERKRGSESEKSESGEAKTCGYYRMRPNGLSHDCNCEFGIQTQIMSDVHTGTPHELNRHIYTHKHL